MSEDLEVYVLEAVASTVERLEEIHIDWLIEGGPGALEGDTLLLSVTQGQLTEDWYGGEFVTKESYDALAAQRDEGLAREADLREALRIAETYVQTAFARAQQKDKLGRKLPADHPISADLSRVLAALASPACADGEKAPTPAINLPRRKVNTEYSTAEEDAQADAWNVALDAVQELNR